MIDALRTAGPMFSVEAKATRSEESAELYALTCGLAESASVYISAVNNDVSNNRIN